MATLRAGALLARRYRLIDPIGAGGMSIIWRARDELLDRMVAIKVLASELAADARFRALVREEARSAAQLVHPHVTAVHDYGEFVDSDGSITAFVVMELLYGEELESRLTAGPLPWQQAIEICAQVAEALAAAHRLGIVHRDVTPANIMLTDNGAKVLDFGIATHIGAPDEDEDGDTFGTPAYVAPERLDGVPAQPATDTYSLGVLLFETLSGRVPFPAETWDDLARARPGGQMPPLVVPGLPASVVDICRQCLSRDPRHRPTAHQVGGSLREQLVPAGRRATGAPSPALPLPAALPPPRPESVPIALATTGGATATLVGGAPGALATHIGYDVGVSPEPQPPGLSRPPRPGGGASPAGEGPGPDRPRGGRPDRAGRRDPADRPDRSDRPGGLVTDPGRPTPAGPDAPPAPGGHGGPYGDGWPGLPGRRYGWSPLRILLAAVGLVAALAAAMLVGLNLGNAKNASTALPQNVPTPQIVPSQDGSVPGTPPAGGQSGSSGRGTVADPNRPPGAGVMTVREAINSLTNVIDDGIAEGDIGRDAGLDLSQLVNNLDNSIAGGTADIDSEVAELQQKVATRANEGAITAKYASRLKTALDRLADAG